MFPFLLRDLNRLYQTYLSKFQQSKVAGWKNGVGKSTLSRLIAGIYEPTEGAILIDGVDVRQIDPDTRKNIGIMLQESWLFSGTIRENIQMGFNEYDDEIF